MSIMTQAGVDNFLRNTYALADEIEAGKVKLGTGKMWAHVAGDVAPHCALGHVIDRCDVGFTDLMTKAPYFAAGATETQLYGIEMDSGGVTTAAHFLYMTNDNRLTEARRPAGTESEADAYRAVADALRVMADTLHLEFLSGVA